jgi:hypothetical protein
LAKECQRKSCSLNVDEIDNRKTSDGTFDDEDYYSESDEIVYCGEESLDLVRGSFINDATAYRGRGITDYVTAVLKS